MVEKQGYKISEAARALGIYRKLLDRWVAKAREKRRPSSPKSRAEVSVHRCGDGQLQGGGFVSGHVGQSQRVLRVASAGARSGSSPTGGAGAGDPGAEAWELREPADGPGTASTRGTRGTQPSPQSDARSGRGSPAAAALADHHGQSPRVSGGAGSAATALSGVGTGQILGRGHHPINGSRQTCSQADHGSYRSCDPFRPGPSPPF